MKMRLSDIEISTYSLARDLARCEESEILEFILDVMGEQQQEFRQKVVDKIQDQINLVNFYREL